MTIAENDYPLASARHGAPVEVGSALVATDDVGTVSSWRPVDWTTFSAEQLEGPRPSVWLRSDGQALLYPGMTHSLYGDSESAKSLLMQAECARLINEGSRVLYVDIESDKSSVYARLVELGADPVAIAEYFVYIRPEENPTEAASAVEFAAVLEQSFDLAVLDGVTEALGLCGLSTNDNDDVIKFNRLLPLRIARRTGAAVVMIDHTAKTSPTSSRYAIGAGAKLTTITGAAFTVVVRIQPMKGRVGIVDLVLTKDRSGAVRPAAGPSIGSRRQLVATVVIDATEPVTRVELRSPDSDAAHRARQDDLKEQIVGIVSDQPGISKNDCSRELGGGKESNLKLIQELLGESVVVMVPDGQKQKLYLAEDAPEE